LFFFSYSSLFTGFALIHVRIGGFAFAMVYVRIDAWTQSSIVHFGTTVTVAPLFIATCKEQRVAVSCDRIVAVKLGRCDMPSLPTYGFGDPVRRKTPALCRCLVTIIQAEKSYHD
jgi:hypothetical protein